MYTSSTFSQKLPKTEYANLVVFKSSLADGGDGIEDANLEEAVCNATILRVFELRKWCQETAKDSGLRTGEFGLFDKLFLNEMNILVSQTKSFYDDTSFKLALKSGFYDFVSGHRDCRPPLRLIERLDRISRLVPRYYQIRGHHHAP